MNVWLLSLAVLPLTARAAASACHFVRWRPVPHPARGIPDRSLRGSTPSRRGRVALLLLGFSYDSRFAVEAWARKFPRAVPRRPARDLL